MSVGVAADGTLTVLRWPSPSFHDHLRHLTTDRRLPRWGAHDAEGLFTGLVWRDGAGRHRLSWLRDATEVTQRYLGERTDTVVTVHVLRDAGATVTVTDDVAADADVLVRHHHVRRHPDTPSRPMGLVAFAVAWDTGADDIDLGPHRGSWHRRRRPEDADPFEAAAPEPGRRRGRTGTRRGRSSATLTVGFRAEADDADATLVVALGGDAKTATTALDAHVGDRGRPPTSVRTAKQRWWDGWLAGARLPATDEAVVVEHALRALTVLRQAVDRHSGAVVASITTQPPYSLDWVRDGAYLNEALLVAGHPEAVLRHDRFYAATIVRAGQRPPGARLTPRGNWPMNLYADGVTGGPIPFEIDETGLGLWTLVRGWEATGDDGYLRDVWPAVAAAADFLTRWRDPATGLPRPAFEDDNLRPVRPASLVSSAPALLGLRAAAVAASAIGADADGRRWSARAAELDAAIDSHAVDPEEPQAFGARGGADYLLWPLAFRPYDHPRMQAQAELTWRRVAPSFGAPHGPRRRDQYEAKALLALAHVWRETRPDRLEDVRRGLRWLASVDVTPGTGLTGEAWFVERGRVVTAVGTPHVWGMALFYLAAVAAWP